MRGPAPRIVLILLASVITVAGCVQPDVTVDPNAGDPVATLTGSVRDVRVPAPDFDFTGVIIPDHGAPNLHAVRELHHGSYGMEVVGYNPLTDKMPIGSAGTGWGALGLWKNYVCVAQLAGTGSIAIVDIADPTKPVVMSQTEDGYVNGDCEFTEDGKYLFAGAYLGAAPSNSVLQGLPVPGAGDVASTGITVWDVEDKSDPKLVLFSDTGTYHTHFLHTKDNVTYLVQAYSGNIYKFDPETPSLDLVTTQTPMQHDMWITKHLITGKTLLFSGADRGFVIYDFDDPENPETLATWLPDENVTGSQGWHRQSTSNLLIDGRAIAVVAGETCGDGKTLPYTAVDITDVTNPVSLSNWQMPGLPEAQGANLCTFSPHEFDIYDGYVISGNYHAGIWLFDIGSAERLVEPVTLGYFLPDHEPITDGDVQNYAFPWEPFVWGALFDSRGYILTADATSGLYILKFDGTPN